MYWKNDFFQISQKRYKNQIGYSRLFPRDSMNTKQDFPIRFGYSTLFTRLRLPKSPSDQYQDAEYEQGQQHGDHGIRF